MTDIVERLRADALPPRWFCLEAADEIERLRAGLKAYAQEVSEADAENDRLRAEMCLTSERWEAENERLEEEIKRLLAGWQDIETAPRDGTDILVARNTGCGWEYYVVWHTDDPDYPWHADGNAYPDDRLDYWRHIEPPHGINFDD